MAATTPIWHRNELIVVLGTVWLLAFCSTVVRGQDRAQDFNPLVFVQGTYTDWADARHAGLLKFSIYDNQVVFFKAQKGAGVDKLTPADVKHFTNGKADVYSLPELNLIGRNGKEKTVPACFGVLLEEGTVNAYVLHITRFGGEPDQYIVLKRANLDAAGVVVPVTFKLKNDQVNTVREQLVQFFGATGSLQAQLDQLGTKANGFINVLSIVQQYNQTE
ncbi:hypothetical protein [Carboxylicivirga taeanensis]|uniref:hypothetical protein n=1 Tax=Carboxylicivirga taeanensis TaxID=1416875 RepID=UPI003F6DBB75